MFLPHRSRWRPRPGRPQAAATAGVEAEASAAGAEEAAFGEVEAAEGFEEEGDPLAAVSGAGRAAAFVPVAAVLVRRAWEAADAHSVRRVWEAADARSARPI